MSALTTLTASSASLPSPFFPLESVAAWPRSSMTAEDVLTLIGVNPFLGSARVRRCVFCLDVHHHEECPMLVTIDPLALIHKLSAP